MLTFFLKCNAKDIPWTRSSKAFWYTKQLMCWFFLPFKWMEPKVKAELGARGLATTDAVMSIIKFLIFGWHCFDQGIIQQ